MNEVVLHKNLNLLKALTAVFGPTGVEEAIRSALQSRLQHPAVQFRTDSIGNLVAYIPGTGANRRKLLFSAHMDTIGFIITEVTKEGFLRFAPLGGFVAADLARAKVLLYPYGKKQPVYGVIVPSEQKESKQFTLDDLYIDIGAADKASAEALLNPGDCGVYCGEFFVQGGRVFSNYLDNRSGCAALVAALGALEGKQPYHDVYLAFTAQEEIGMRGAKTVAFDLNVDYAFAVDVTCTGDQPGSDSTASAQLGKGAALKLMDHSVLCNRQLLAQVQKIAEEGQIPWQMDIMKSGGTDAGSLQFTGGGIQVGGISIPCRYTHTPVECIDASDFNAVIKLIYSLMEGEFTRCS